MKKLTLALLLLTLTTGCTYKTIARTNKTGTAYSIDLAAIEKYDLDEATVRLHEELHLKGYRHCENRNCIMHKFIYPRQVKTWLCMNCRTATLWRRN